MTVFTRAACRQPNSFSDAPQLDHYHKKQGGGVLHRRPQTATLHNGRACLTHTMYDPPPWAWCCTPHQAAAVAFSAAAGAAAVPGSLKPSASTTGRQRSHNSGWSADNEPTCMGEEGAGEAGSSGGEEQGGSTNAVAHLLSVLTITLLCDMGSH